MYIYIYIYIYGVCVGVCVCTCACCTRATRPIISDEKTSKRSNCRDAAIQASMRHGHEC